MRSAPTPVFYVLFMIAAAGVIYLAARLLSNPQTRKLSAVLLAVIGIFLGYLLIGVSVRSDSAPAQSATIDYRTEQNSQPPWQGGTLRIETDFSRPHLYPQGPTPVAQAGYGISNWARWSVLGLVIVAIVVASRSRQAAVAIAGVAVVAALGFLFAARSSVSQYPVASTPTLIHDFPLTAPAQPPASAKAPSPAVPTHPNTAIEHAAPSPANDPAHTGPSKEKPRLNKPDRQPDETAAAAAEGATEAADATHIERETAKSDVEVIEERTAVAESAPERQPRLPDQQPQAKPRPAWIDEPPSFSGGVYTTTVSSTRHASTDECEPELDNKMWSAVWNHAQKHIGPQAGYLRYNIPLIREFVVDTYPERHESPLVGTMWQVHARLKIDDAARRKMESHIHGVQVSQRVENMTRMSASMLGGLGVIYCALRFGPRRKKPADEPVVAA